jgi:hypothetical protein
MRAVRGACVVLFLLLANACGGGGSASLQFVLPTDGTVVDAPLLLAVTGSGISRATFDVDGTLVGDVASAPFEWTLDATAYTGDHVVTIVAHLDDGEHTMSATLTFAGVVFLAPAEGSVVTAPEALAAEGATVTSVEFRLDGARMLLDTDAPFTWTLDPEAVAEGDHEIVIEAFLATGSRSRTIGLRTVKLGDEPPPPDGVLAAIAALKPGEWYEIADTHLRDVAASPSPGGTIASVMGAWSGGAYDTKRSRLIVWGGGHGDYAGNEVYVFSMKSFRWSRLNEPNRFPPGEEENPQDKTRFADGNPVPRHSYDTLEYLPNVDRFFVGGGAGLWWSGQFSDDTTYLFNFDTLDWTQHAKCPVAAIAAMSALGPDGRVWMHGSSGAEAVLAAFDPKNAQWTRYAEYGGWLGYARNAEIDPVENKFVAIGGDVRIWDLDKPNAQHVVAKTTGTGPTEDESGYPGVAYDPKTKKFVVWNGGSTVYSFDVGALHWTAHATKGVNTTPPAASGNGTNGRWRYVPSLKVFVVVNHVDENVFVYRHS